METFENSWHIGVPDLKDAKIMHHHYICTCGNTKQISLANHQIDFPYIKCSKCSNTYYLDLETFQDKHTVRYWKAFHWSYELSEDTEGWHMLFYYNTPVLQNSLTKIGVRKKPLKKISLFKNGLHQIESFEEKLLKCHIYDDNNMEIEKLIHRQIAKPFSLFVAEHISDEIAWIDLERLSEFSDEEKLRLFSFFLRHPHMHAEVLYRWSFKGSETLQEQISSEQQALSLIRGEQAKKSVRRALFKTYQANTAGYNPLFDYLVCHLFEDENIVVDLLTISNDHKLKLFDGFSLETSLEALGFLERYYTQKELRDFINISLNSRDALVMFHDILRMLSDEETLAVYLQHFERVRANLKVLHD